MDVTKPNVLVVDRSGYRFYVDRRGAPIVSPDAYNVFFMTKSMHVKGVRLTDLAGLLVTDTDDKRAICEVARALHAAAPLHRIVVLAERHLEIAGELRDEFGIPGMSLGETLPFRDKLLMKQRVAAAGVRVPAHVAIRSPLDAAVLLLEHGKIIVKPVDGMGTEHTFAIASMAELEELARRADLAFDRFEAEEFIDGVHYHVDGLVVGGEVVAATPYRYARPLLGFERLESTYEIQETEPRLVERMLELHAQAVWGLGLREGATHLECFLTPADELVFCEVAVRTGGWAMADMFESLHGVDPRRVMLEFQLGLGLRWKPTPQARCVGEIVFFPRPGRLVQISRLDDFPESWIYSKRIRPVVGDVLRWPIMTGDIAAVFVVTGDNQAHVMRRLAEVRERFEMEVEPVP